MTTTLLAIPTARAIPTTRAIPTACAIPTAHAIPTARAIPTDISSKTTEVYWPCCKAIEQQVLLDTRLIAILDAPLAARESPTEGFSRKERDLGNAFAQLSIDQAAEMFDRLVVNYAGDALARKFNKLTEERRGRLLDFLDLMTDPIRRQGLMSAMT